MNEREMLDVVQSAVKEAGTPDATAELTERREASVRFGQNRVTQNLDVFRRELRVTVGDGSRKATVHSQRIDMDSLPALASEARALLETSAVDPEYMPPVPQGQSYESIPEAWDEKSASCPAAPRMEASGLVIDTARSHGYEASGLYRMTAGKTALCTSTGNSVFHRTTESDMSFTMDRGLASSYRSLSGTRWSEMNIAQAAEEVAAEVELDKGAVDVQPGEYSIILEPQATWNLVMFIPWLMNARTADQGVSVFSGMEGKQITGSDFTLSSSLHGNRPGRPFDGEGLPASDTTWIDQGVVKNLSCDRFTAQKTGRPPLFFPGTVDLNGGKGTVADLVKQVEKGILIRRFWYIRFVDQKTLKITGMTRDGVFLVEKGEIVKPLKDFRWNWRPLELFSSVDILGEAVRSGPGMVPPVVIAPQRFPFTD